MGVKLSITEHTGLKSHPDREVKRLGRDVKHKPLLDSRLWMSRAIHLIHLSALCLVMNGHLLRSCSYHRLQLVLQQIKHNLEKVWWRTTELCFWPFHWLWFRTNEFSKSWVFMTDNNWTKNVYYCPAAVVLRSISTIRIHKKFVHKHHRSDSIWYRTLNTGN